MSIAMPKWPKWVSAVIGVVALVIIGVVVWFVALGGGFSAPVWVATKSGLPDGAFVIGQDAAGEKLYSCRAPFNKGLHAGRMTEKLGVCQVSWGGKVNDLKGYEVLTGAGLQWVAGPRTVPDYAVVAGNEHPPGSQMLFVCRANVDGGQIPGKFRPGISGCNLPTLNGGRKETVTGKFEVLVARR